MDEAVTYQELDSIDNPKLYTEDDVVEVFIRANSGGTRLGKSDLLFSLLRASWEVADDEMEDLLESLNKHGFAKLQDLKDFTLEEVFGVIRSQGRSLELTEDRLWQMGYGSDTIHLLFNLWYRDFNHTPAYDRNLPQVDHIFPQSLLKKVKVENPKTGRKDLMKYRDADRNQLANCMLLSREENAAGGKSDIPPDEWFRDKDKVYLGKHLIPGDPALWKLDRFEDFIAARRKLQEKFGHLLVATP